MNKLSLNLIVRMLFLLWLRESDVWEGERSCQYQTNVDPGDLSSLSVR